MTPQNGPTVEEISKVLYESLELLRPTVRTALLLYLSKEYGIVAGKSISLERLEVAFKDYFGTRGVAFVWDIKRRLGLNVPYLIQP